MTTEHIDILLIEDNRVDTLLIQAMLAKTTGVSFNLEIADMLEKGLTRVSEKDYDVILTDLGLPDSRGIQTFKKVYENARGIPIMVLTGHDDESVAVSAIQLGAQDYLVKGKTDSDLLIRSIRYAIERNRSERALKESKEEWERTFDAIDDMIAILDPDMRIMRTNRAGMEILQISDMETMIGKPCYEIFRGTARPCPECPKDKVIREHKSVTEEIEHLPLDKIFQITLSPIFDENSRFIGLVHVAKDISEKKKMEEQLRRIQIMEAIGTLAGGIAHDLNNILFPIYGYTEMTMEDLPPDSLAQKNLSRVMKAADRARDMVQQILTFSRQGHEGERELKPLRIQPIIKEALKLLRGSLPATIEIRHNINEKCDCVMADPTQIHQVVMNLCTNAYHAMREKGGILEISLDEVKISNDSSGRDSGSYLQLAVSDTGNGMDPATIKKIFDPYFTTKPRGEGTGLGLSVVHGIMKRHKGYVTVESEPEHGTAFYAYLPLIDSLPDEPAAVSSASFSTGYERILLVDDEEPITEMLRQILERLGYQVTARTSSVEALKAFQSQPGNFDLVITDTTMPNMTGIELCRAITKIRPDIPVVLCTGFSETITEEKADAAGIKGFIMKPVSIREMAGVIRRVLDSGV